MLEEKIKNDLKEAMKAKNDLVVSTLRFLISAINNKFIEKQQELKDEDILQVIQRQAKEHKESIEAFKAGSREDLVKKEEGELAILEKYLPERMNDQELKKVVDGVIKETGAENPTDFGKVMGQVMARVKGQADGTLVAQAVKERLAPQK